MMGSKERVLAVIRELYTPFDCWGSYTVLYIRRPSPGKKSICTAFIQTITEFRALDIFSSLSPDTINPEICPSAPDSRAITHDKPAQEAQVIVISKPREIASSLAISYLQSWHFQIGQIGQDRLYTQVPKCNYMKHDTEPKEQSDIIPKITIPSPRKRSIGRISICRI